MTKGSPRGRGEAPWDPHHGPVPKEHGRATTRLSRALARISKNISPAGPGEGLPDRAVPSAVAGIGMEQYDEIDTFKKVQSWPTVKRVESWPTIEEIERRLRKLGCTKEQ